MIQKIYNKSKAWAKHGKHKGLHGTLVEMNRPKSKRKDQQYDSVVALFEEER